MDPTKDFLFVVACFVVGFVFIVNLTRWVRRDTEMKQRMTEMADTVLIKNDVLLNLLSRTGKN